ncbi:MAG TPA: bifunctional homocysteine S-methyltransferase/methylenetetrahydrofolate reductase [Clostridia bacterium]|nr:bifunctional homocysteine S-methyltransferase/methylenetetrahydrofolate reductase [Clostridia bacterium]
METIKEYLKNHLLIADGATGTYLSVLAGRSSEPCEMLNLKEPGLVAGAHREYIRSGAGLILTNTFYAGSLALENDPKTAADIIKAGFSIAAEAAGSQAYAAADFGPVVDGNWEKEQAEEEYRRLADAFLDAGARIFLFETFANDEIPVQTARYIKSRLKDAFVMISFAVLPDGHTRLGVKGDELLRRVIGSGAADSVGFNCCSGPAHLLEYALSQDYGGLYPLIMPNSGYPFRQEDEIVYPGSPQYFGSKLAQAAASGFKIIGGCCGTTPEHIRCLAKSVIQSTAGESNVIRPQPTAGRRESAGSGFRQALQSGRKTAVVELDPPFNSDIARFEAAAGEIAACGVDAITIADSPMARPRADSVAIAARLKRQLGVDVIPHISCRDKNLNAIKSALIAAHIEGIRNVLAVTGDPVPDTDRGSVRSVFNLNSVSLCTFIRDLGSDIFKGDEIFCGCAYNVNARNIDKEIDKLDKKIQAGAGFVLTQPLFTEESVCALERIRKKGVKTIAGILTPVSYRNAMFLNNEMPGIVLPEETVARFLPEMTREQGEQAGIEISLEIAEKIADLVDGFYFIVPFNRVRVTAKIIRELRDRKIL